MYLTKLLMRDFGKFHNAEISLKPGINVIEGEKNSGKTTIREFITGILYGIRKQNELSGEGVYEAYRPEGRSRYSGTGYAKQDDKTYLIDRSFLAGAKKTSVLDVQTGREVMLKNPDTLAGSVLTTDRNSYQDTYVIAGSETGAAEELATYLSNKIQTGSGSLNREKAIEYLKKERRKADPRPLIRRLDDLTEKLEAYDDVDDALAANKQAMRQLTDDFAIEAAKRKRVARQLVENEDGTVTYKADEELDRKLDRLTEAQKTYGAVDEKEEEPKEKPWTDSIVAIILTGLFVIGVIAAIVYLLPFEDAVRKLFILFTAIFVVITIIDGYRAKGYFRDEEAETPTEEDFNRVLEELEEEHEKQEETEFDMTFAKEFSAKKDQLKADEAVLLDRRHARDKLRKEQSQVFKKKSELEEEVRAINLAITTIDNLSVKYQEKAAMSFVPYLSEYITPLSGGRFGNLSFDSAEGLTVEGAGGSFALEVLPEELASRIYLAVRLSIAKRCDTERLPLVIDDAVHFVSESEADAFLDVLDDLEKEQIVLLSSDKYLRRALDARGAAYNYVSL
ncbi:MAG: AAA family ATPase [Eubacterium sp.]|nr:AAA family ATPase [Eubacterium sp.]